jgi:hypothetical protein
MNIAKGRTQGTAACRRNRELYQAVTRLKPRVP